MRQAVASRLGYDPFFPSADKTILARIDRTRNDLRGTVELVDDRGLLQGAREFHLPVSQCEDLVATMALAISIAVDPTIDASTIETSAAPAVDAPRNAETKTRATNQAPEPRAQHALEQDNVVVWPKNRATSAPPRVFEERAGVAATSSFGTVPATALGVAASVGILLDHLSLDLEGRHDGAASVGAPGGGAADASLWSGTLAPCVHWGVWIGCGLGAFGWLHATGTNLVTSRTGNALYIAAGGRVGLELRLIGPMFLKPTLDVVGNLARTELRVDGKSLWKAPLVSAALGSGLLLVFR